MVEQRIPPTFKTARVGSSNLSTPAIFKKPQSKDRGFLRLLFGYIGVDPMMEQGIPPTLKNGACWEFESLHSCHI